MVKIQILIVLLCSSFALARKAEITLSRSFLPEYVAQKENVKPEDIRQIVLQKDKEFKNGVILLNSSMSCGVGLCSYYAFVKNAQGSFNFAGMIEGVFKETSEVKNSDLPDIWTQTKSGKEIAAKTKWTFNKVTKTYEAQ